MELNEIIAMDQQHFMNTFGKRTPVCFTHGKGTQLWDTQGRQYTDFFAGIAVSALGHAHPHLVGAIQSQAEKLIHCSNLYYIETQAKLAKKITEISCADKVFFSNSGAEANEGALKLAKIYFYKQGKPQKNEIITLVNSFHGRTLATVAATGQAKYQKPYLPLIPGIKNIPMNDLATLKAAITDATCAIMLEPIQGESGVNAMDEAYLKEVRALCDEKDILLIFDEVQTGLGRTGKMLGYQHFGIEPDIFTLAKALGGGVPIGAVCAKDRVAQAFEPGDHGSTFGGNPLACAAGLAVLETLEEEKLVENAEKMGKLLKDKLLALSQKHPVITEFRGKGLMVGVQLSQDIAVDVKDQCFEKGYLTGAVGKNILRLLPPLIVTAAEVEGFISTLDAILDELQQ